jgi:hypothetical protein
MPRVLFELDMPNRGSWDGGWSGSGKTYNKVKTLDKKSIQVLLPDGYNSWRHSWNDGWTARVKARVLKTGERKPKSAGFCGYDWMVDSIICYNEIRYMS